jgi:hypothetical protein
MTMNTVERGTKTGLENLGKFRPAPENGRDQGAKRLVHAVAKTSEYPRPDHVGKSPLSFQYNAVDVMLGEFLGITRRLYRQRSKD